MPHQIFFSLEEIAQALQIVNNPESRHQLLEVAVGEQLWSMPFNDDYKGPMYHYGKILCALSDEDQLNLLMQGYKTVPFLSTLAAFKRIYHCLTAKNKLTLLVMQSANKQQVLCKELGIFLLQYTPREDVVYDLLKAQINLLPTINTMQQLTDNWPFFLDSNDKTRVNFLLEVITVSRLTNEILLNLNDYFRFFKFFQPHERAPLYPYLKAPLLSKVHNFMELAGVLREVDPIFSDEDLSPRLCAMVNTFEEFKLLCSIISLERITQAHTNLMTVLCKVIKNPIHLSEACNGYVNARAIAFLVTKLITDKQIRINGFSALVDYLKAIPSFIKESSDTFFSAIPAESRGQIALIRAVRPDLPALIQSRRELAIVSELFGKDEEGKVQLKGCLMMTSEPYRP